METQKNQRESEIAIDNYDPRVLRRIGRDTWFGTFAGGITGITSLIVANYCMDLTSYDPNLWIAGILGAGAVLGHIFFRNYAIRKAMKSHPLIAQDVKRWSELTNKVFNEEG